MGADTAIEWATHTFNPWTGCTRVSPGCDHCYAAEQAKRNPRTFGSWEPGGARKRTSAAYWQQPLRWNREAERTGTRPRVFCASMADVFDNQVDPAWHQDLWELIHRTPHLDWLLLTKRPQNIAGMLPMPGVSLDAATWPWPNVWLGTTVENQAEAARRIPHLLAVPARVRFLSCEPLLGPVDLTAVEVMNSDGSIDALNPSCDADVWASDWDPASTGTTMEEAIEGAAEWGIRYPPSSAPHPKVNWVIAGGESGPNARPMHPDWARSLRDQCAAAGVPFFFKQWGEWGLMDSSPVAEPAGKLTPYRITDSTDRKRVGGTIYAAGRGPDERTDMLERLGKKAAGRLLDGGEHNGAPSSAESERRAA